MAKAITAMRNMSAKELLEQLDNSYRELQHLRFSYAVARSLQNPARIRQLKRTVARALTIQKEKGFETQVLESQEQKQKQKEKGKKKPIRKSFFRKFES